MHSLFSYTKLSPQVRHFALSLPKSPASSQPVIKHRPSHPSHLHSHQVLPFPPLTFSAHVRIVVLYVIDFSVLGAM